MAHYLFTASYTSDGVKGLLKGGGTARLDATRTLIEGLGGTLESYYFSFGSEDVVAIAELPDNATAAAVALAVSSSGRIAAKTTVLLTPAELDQAAQKQVSYTPPGG